MATTFPINCWEEVFTILSPTCGPHSHTFNKVHVVSSSPGTRDSCQEMEGLEAIGAGLGQPTITISPLMKVLMSERPGTMPEDSHDVEEGDHGINTLPELGKF